MKMETSVVMRYCQVLDEFVKIRLFTEEESHDLLPSVSCGAEHGGIEFIIRHLWINMQKNSTDRKREDPMGSTGRDDGCK